MAQTAALIDTLKQALKSHRLTYAEVAAQLDMSEANIKRMFASRRFTLDRLEQICALMQMELTDLVALYEESLQQISQLTVAQEQELVSDVRLLLVAVSVRNRMSFEEIVNNYNISEPECISALATLDRLKIIDLLPGNRIKLRIDEAFRWLPGGPIEDFFESQIQGQFLQSRFAGELEQRLFLFGLLGDGSVRQLLDRMQALASEVRELHRKDAKLPFEKRHNIGFMLALRPWEVEAFRPFQRKGREKDGPGSR